VRWVPAGCQAVVAHAPIQLVDVHEVDVRQLHVPEGRKHVHVRRNAATATWEMTDDEVDAVDRILVEHPGTPGR
jgi:hypothetical protein